MKISRAFYQWDSHEITDEDDSLLRRLDVQALYTHLFDVDVDGQYAPYPISWGDSFYGRFNLSDSVAFIPTVFITNRTFSHMDDTAVADLANRVHKKIRMLLNQMADSRLEERYPWFEMTIDPYQTKMRDMHALARRDSGRKEVYDRISEIQFDCDWTPSTKDKYFLFLSHMKKKFPDKLLSATIRLYPYKYPEKAGVPPVDKGMLMCYNAGDVRKMESGNSIFDKKDVLAYLDTDKPYPLKLDYALPIFDWCALYRNGKLIALLPSDEFDFECRDYRCYYELETAAAADLPRYRVTEEHTLGYSSEGQLLKVGDIIKVERPDLNDVAAVARKLGNINTNPEPRVSLFHFNMDNVKKHEKQIQKIYGSF